MDTQLPAGLATVLHEPGNQLSFGHHLKGINLNRRQREKLVYSLFSSTDKRFHNNL